MMIRAYLRVVGSVLILGMTLQVAAFGQAEGTPPPGEPRDSGTLPWLVIQGSLEDFSGQSDQIVADFATQGQSQAAAAGLNQAEKEPAKWRYAYRERHPVSVALDGQTWMGRIGKYHVFLNFATGGQFTVSGEMQGQGQWRQSADGVLLETPLATYRGRVGQDRISGVRFVKSGAEALIDWSVRRCSPSSAEPLGRWVQEIKGPRSQTIVTLFLRPDNTGMWLHDFHDMTAQGGMVKSRLLRVEVRWRVAKEPGTGSQRDGILLEQTRGDQPWLTHWIELDDEGLVPPWSRAG